MGFKAYALLRSAADAAPTPKPKPQIPNPKPQEVTRRHVRRLQIGTHSSAIHTRLKQLLTSGGFTLEKEIAHNPLSDQCDVYVKASAQQVVLSICLRACFAVPDSSCHALDLVLKIAAAIMFLLAYVPAGRATNYYETVASATTRPRDNDSSDVTSTLSCSSSHPSPPLPLPFPSPLSCPPGRPCSWCVIFSA